MKFFFTAFLFLLIIISITGATTFVVPSPQCPTIQAGLDSCSAADTVMVAAGTYYENLSWPGLDGIVMISNSGPALTIIDGSSVDRVIDIASGVGNTTVVYGFTIQNGYSHFGAGITCSYNSSPTITNNIIRQNIAYLQGGAGIGCTYSSSPIIRDNILTDNSATYGGGGGILVAENSNPMIDSNRVANNSAGMGGGGILIHDGCAATIIDNEISNNTALTGGGGLYLQGSTSTVSGNTITGNLSNGGGGGIGLGRPDASTIDGNDISYNISHENGGGIRCKTGASPTIINNSITYNKADSLGGGICVIDQSQPTISVNIITGNTAYYSGGGIGCTNGASPVITNNIIKQDTSDAMGGGGITCSYNSSPLIATNLISENVALNGGGGGILCAYYSNPIIENDTITHNYAGGGGGGLLIYVDCYGSIRGSEISHNRVVYSGGGIAFYQSGTQVTNCTITGNTANRGGGINFQEYDLSTVTRSIISENTALNGQGGGIRADTYSLPTIDSCTVTNNTGHGAFSENGARPQFHFSDICHNSNFGLYNADSLNVTIAAENNWWGDASGPFHSQTNPGGCGCAVSGGVQFQPWYVHPVVNITTSESAIFPDNFILFQNYPNPFNPTTIISWQLAVSSPVQLSVYTLTGQKVATLVDRRLTAGYHSVNWDASNYASGVYLYRLEAEGIVKTHKMILVR